MSTQEKNSVLSVSGLSKVYKDADASKTILADVSLEVAEREFLCILGPSGCGKTTLLRCVAGFEDYTGEVLVDGKPAREPGIDRVMVFQDFNQLFPKSLNEYPIGSFAEWIPGQLSEDSLPEGFRFEYNNAVPTCRLLNQPYDPTSPLTQYYVIDGYIVSDNLRVESVKTLDLDFTNADHNPVELTAVLETEQEGS